MIGRTTTGHTTSPIFGRVCLRIRFVGRDRIVPHTLGTPISAAIPFEKESLFGRDQGQLPCARDREPASSRREIRPTSANMLRLDSFLSRQFPGGEPGHTTRRPRSEQMLERPQAQRPHRRWCRRTSVARLGAADLTAAVLVKTGAACDSMAAPTTKPPTSTRAATYILPCMARSLRFRSASFAPLGTIQRDSHSRSRHIEMPSAPISFLTYSGFVSHDTPKERSAVSQGPAIS